MNKVLNIFKKKMSSLDESQKKWIDSVALWLKAQVEDAQSKKTQEKTNSAVSEIELRFGTFLNAAEVLHDKKHLGSFVSGINITAWKRIQAMFANADPTMFTLPPQSELEIISIFDDDEQVVRSIEHADGSVTTEKKLLIAEKNFVFREPSTMQLICVRLAHNREIPVNEIVTKLPSLVRVRARTSFWHRMWRIDLSMIQQGVDNDAASRAPAIFEVELELLHHLVDWTRYDFHYLASSMLLKIQEITEALLDVSMEKSFLNIVFLDE